MAHRYRPGDIAYIVENVIFIREVQILRISGGWVTMRFTDTGGGVRLRENRLFPSKEAARATMPENPYPNRWS